MDTEKCSALLCVLESGSITGAAEKLGYTVSGISRMMASLEAETGFPLLLRSKAGVVPTEECRLLMPTIHELARLGKLYADRSNAVRGLEVGIIRVGSAYSAYYDTLAQTIASFSKLHPGIEISFLQGSSSELYAQLDAHSIDLCIVSRWENDNEFFLAFSASFSNSFFCFSSAFLIFSASRSAFSCSFFSCSNAFCLSFSSFTLSSSSFFAVISALNISYADSLSSMVYNRPVKP